MLEFLAFLDLTTMHWRVLKLQSRSSNIIFECHNGPFCATAVFVVCLCVNEYAFINLKDRQWDDGSGREAKSAGKQERTAVGRCLVRFFNDEKSASPSLSSSDSSR